ncbi:hypothetical protein [Roseomonas harenae]|uniref:hypothetical protein n=1 Tax=Muricoccus harenae TaxID=2692566 RepID=UPI00133134E7|nr:hypothetical protein [Roseomonas harenae]
MPNTDQLKQTLSEQMRAIFGDHPPPVQVSDAQIEAVASEFAVDYEKLLNDNPEIANNPEIYDLNPFGFKIEFPKKLPDPFKGVKKEACILAHIAIAAALVAAWVASGGTLVVGSTVAGVVITDTIYAALAGGLTGAALAEKFC